MLYQFGPVSFAVRPLNAATIQQTASTTFAKKPILGTRVDLEHTGEAEQTVTLSGATFPVEIGGENELLQLQAVRRSAVPHLLMRGDGVPLGWFVVETIDSTGEDIDFDGAPRYLSYTIAFCRAAKPPAPAASISIYEMFL